MRLFSLLAVGAGVASTTAADVPGQAFDRFITIWLENQDYTQVEKNADIKALAKEGISLTRFYGLTHPSQPNYIASVGGDYFGMDHDEIASIPRNVSTVVDLFDTKGISWKGYFEGIPGPGYMGEGSTDPGGNAWAYVSKHNPFISYESINHNGTRLANIQSFVEFHEDVKANKLPQYAHMSPNMDNDGHDTSLEFAANWTQSFLAPLLANKEFMNNTLILLTYDESATYEIPNKIVSILLGGAIPSDLKGTTDDVFYTHYSVLSTLQNNWGLPNLGRYDVGANVFDFVARKTGYSNHPPSNVDSVNNSLSYGGFLHSDKNLYMPLPPPNLQLIGAGGKGVSPTVMKAWDSTKNAKTPYDGSGIVYDGGDGKTNPNKPVYKAQAPAPKVTGRATDPPAPSPPSAASPAPASPSADSPEPAPPGASPPGANPPGASPLGANPPAPAPPAPAPPAPAPPAPAPPAPAPPAPAPPAPAPPNPSPPAPAPVGASPSGANPSGANPSGATPSGATPSGATPSDADTPSPASPTPSSSETSGTSGMALLGVNWAGIGFSVLAMTAFFL